MLSFLLARRRVTAAAFVLAGVGILVVHPTWAESLGVDVWNVPALEDELRAAEGADRELTGQSQEVRHRIAVKDAIVSNLLAGQTTLADATERFRELNAERPEYVETIRATYPGETDQEKAARNVISFAVTRAAPEERDAVVARLEGELRQMTGEHATE